MLFSQKLNGVVENLAITSWEMSLKNIVTLSLIDGVCNMKQSSLAALTRKTFEG